MAGRFIGRAGWIAAAALAAGTGGFAAREHIAAWAQPLTETTETAVRPDRPAQPVRVTRVTFSMPPSRVTFTGTIRPRQEVDLSFRLPGQLVARPVEVGDRVVAGQVVARLDDTDARLELDAATAERNAAVTDLARAKADAARSLELFAAGHIAQAALDRATSAEAEARSRAERAMRTQALAENRLAYTTLRAEADGIVTATLAQSGQVLAPGLPVVSVAETSALDVVFALPENRRDLLITATASATLWGAEGKDYGLTLRDVSPDVEPIGRTYRVRMTLTNPDAGTALGRTLTVHLKTDGAAPVAVLPLAAVLSDGAGPAVWRLGPRRDMVERVPVEMVEIDGHVAQVSGPLAEGDLVVSLGANKVDPARPVRVVETSASPES